MSEDQERLVGCQRLYATIAFTENSNNVEGAVDALHEAGFIDVVELPLDPKAPHFQDGDRTFEAAMVTSLSDDVVFDWADEIVREFGGECQQLCDTSLLEYWSAKAID